MTASFDTSSSVSLHRTLREIEARGTASRTSGDPLWKYQVTEAELEALREGLRAALRRHDESRATAAALCLFGALHFCRTHDGGAWSWDGIFDACGWEHGAGERLYELVRTGLRYWRCDDDFVQKSGRTYYHRTLACLGGLPLKLLAGNHNAVQRYFARLIRATEQYDQPVAELVDAFDYLLPQTLRNDIVSALAVQLVDAIVELRRSRAEAHHADPIAALDRVDPKWRTTIPLRLDDAVAEELLRGLFHEVARDERAGSALSLEVVLSLRVDGTARLERSIRLQPSMDEDALARLLGVSELPSYLYLSLLLPDGTRRPVATAQRFESRFRLSPTVPQHPVGRGEGLLGAIRLVASVGAEDLGVGEIPGGQPVPEELPWVLEGSSLDREVIPVRAFGSGRAAGGKMLLLLPPEGELELDRHSLLDELADRSPEGRRLVRLHGAATWQSDDDRCRFVTGGREELAPYTLVGKVMRTGFAGSEVWRGAPSVVRIEEGRERLVERSAIDWRPTSGGAWRSMAQRPLGDVVLRVRDEGETVFRTRATIAPADLRVDVKPAVQGKGRLTVSSRELRGVTVERTADVEATVTEASAGSIDVALAITTEAATSLKVGLLFGDGLEARVEVPCPVQLRRFVGFDGRPLGRAEVRAVDRMGGVRVRAVELADQALALEARLPGTTGFRPIARVRAEGQTLSELSLDRVSGPVATLLARSLDIDARVELRVVPWGGALRGGAPTMTVGRYDTELVPERDAEGWPRLVRLTPSSASILGAQGLEALRVDIRPVDAPASEPVTLERISQTEWRVPPTLAPGPWLVLGWQGAWARLRPLLLTIHGERESEAPAHDAIQRAIRVVDADERAAALDAVIATELAADYRNPLWGRVLEITKLLGTLPAMTFDLTRRLAESPDAAALLAVQVPEGRLPSVWSGLEELPFLWATLPVRSWVRAARSVHRWLQAEPAVAVALGGLGPETTRRLTPFFDAAPRRAPFMETVLEVIAQAMPHTPPVRSQQLSFASSPEGAAISSHLSKQEAQAVLQRNATRWWPSADLRGLVGDELWSLVRQHRVHAQQPHHASAFNAPVAAAAAAATGTRLSADALFELRLHRDFDPGWFDFAHAQALTQMIADRLTLDPEAYDD